MEFVPRILLATLCFLPALATSAFAKEPKGFLEWPWGTMYEIIAQDQSWCRSREKFLEGRETITCHLHFVGDIPITPLILDFQPSEALSGYSMSFESESYAKIRSVAVERFGPPTSTASQQYRTGAGRSVSGEALVWRWPSGTFASLTELCGGLGRSCLNVSTKALADSRRKKEEEKTEERKKGF